MKRERGGTRRSKHKSKSAVTVGVLAFLFLWIAGSAGSLHAQTVTGQITGTVTDPTGAIVSGAKVSLTNSLTQQVRSLTTNTSGDFQFTDVVPGTYELQITQSGFSTYDQKSIVLGTREDLALHQIPLQVGAVTSEVTVSAVAARVETDTSAHSGLVTDTQITSIPDKGRNFKDYLQLLPGTVSSGQTDAPGWGSGAVQFNGGDAGTVLVQLDGIASQDTGAPTNGGYISPSVDSIQEMRVQTGNENAEFGGRAGGTVNVTTKSGTGQFHGDVYEFNRNNFYNSNDYFRKENSNPAISGHPAPYKFNNFGGVVGGPILLPFTQWNRTRNKAFFFVSSDNLHRTVSSNPSNQTMPTLAERAGVFTNLTQNLTDPAGVAPTCTGTSPSITCVFPASDMNVAGQKFLSLLPLPNCLRAGDTATGLNAPLAGLPACPASGNNAFNYNFVNVTPHPWWNDTMRADFNISNTETFYIRLLKNYEQTQGQFGFLGGSGSWPQSLINYTIHSDGAVGTLVSTLRSNLVNEATFGTNYALQTVDPFNKAALDNNNRALLGLGPTVLPVLFPDASNGGAQTKQVNEHDLIPNVSFGGFTNENATVGGKTSGGTIANAPGFSFESRYPFFGTDSDWTATDNLSWVKGAHSLKFGGFYEHVSRTTATYSNRTGAQFNGVLNFTSASTNPFDTGNTFANAYTGVYQQYAEDNKRSNAHGLNYDVEWFAQDTWKITRRLTIDYGMRFSILVPDYLRNDETIAQFTPADYKLSLQPGLIKPCLNGTARVGCESNGTFVSPSVIGLFDPTTYAANCTITGNAKCPYQGMVTFAGKAYNTPHVGIGPRFGFAWDVLGNGKTAVRGGFGMFYDRTGGIDDVLTQVDQPPLILGPSIYNGTIGQLLATPPSQLFIGPQTAYGNVRDFSMPQVYDFNLGVQRDLGRGLLLDVSYVGNVSRHGRRTTDLTDLPYGEDFQPQFIDATESGNKPLPANLIRCLDTQLICGYNSEPFATFDANSNYNSLQATVTKRFGRSLTAGAAYTYSKVLDEGGCCNRWLPDSYYYGPGSQDRTHNVTVNWSYNLPDTHFDNRFAKLVTNGWTVQGIASFITGAPGTVSWTYSGDPNGATNGGNQGGPTQPSLVSGQSVYGSRDSATHFLNAAAFQAAPNGPGACILNKPGACGLGTSSPRKVFTQPGVNNWDISLFKNIRYSSNESRYIQLRWETYNTFNHTQFSNLGGSSTTANNSSFGRVTSAQPPRIMALAVKVYF